MLSSRAFFRTGVLMMFISIPQQPSTLSFQEKNSEKDPETLRSSNADLCDIAFGIRGRYHDHGRVAATATTWANSYSARRQCYGRESNCACN
jgi:hypothetical protein